MKLTPVCALVLLVFAATCARPCYGESGRQDMDVEWRNRFIMADFTAVVEMLENDEAAWPHLASFQWMQTHDRSRIRYTLMAILVLDKMRDFDTWHLSDIRGAIPLYARAIEAFRARGGYANYVLATAAESLAVSRLSSYIIEHPGEYELVKELLDEVPRVPLVDPVLIAVFSEELGADVVAENGGEVTIGDIAGMLNMDVWELASHGYADRMTSRQLLKETNLAGLFWRRVMLSKAMHMQIPAYLDFLSRGGKASSGAMPDGAEWDKLMGPVAKQYGMPELGMRTVPRMHVSTWVEACSKGHRSTPFYSMALE